MPRVPFAAQTVILSFACLVSGLRAEPIELKVLTFNILVEISSVEGVPPWKERRDEMVQLIKNLDPDLLGLQEPMPRQAAFLKEALPDYEAIQDEKFTDVILMFRRSMFETVDRGEWWLSPTPDKRMSKGFGNFLPRILVWARLKHVASGRELLVANTHFDNSMPSQVKMAALCQERFRSLGMGDLPMIWMGDFNTDQNRGDYPMLVSDGWKDSYTASPLASPGGRDDNAPTFPGNPGKRIDHIFYRGPFTPTHWEVVSYADPKRHLSDHFPVFAKLKW